MAENFLENVGMSAVQSVEPPIRISNDDQYQLYREHGMWNSEASEMQKFQEGRFKIEDISGIRSRSFFPETANRVDILQEAAQKVLDEERINVKDCSRFVLASTRPDVGQLGADLQKQIGLRGKGINWACSGFVAALCEAKDYLAKYRADHVLVITAEMWGDMVNLLDKNTVVFGDGIYAFLLTQDPQRHVLELLDARVQSFADKKNSIQMVHRYARGPAGSVDNRSCIHMNGRSVFSVAPRQMVERGQRFLVDRCNTTLGHVGMIPHGANQRFVPHLVRYANQYGLFNHERSWKDSDIHMDISQTGNMGCSSVPGYVHEHLSDIESGNRWILATVIGAGRDVEMGRMTAGQALLAVPENGVTE